MDNPGAKSTAAAHEEAQPEPKSGVIWPEGYAADRGMHNVTSLWICSEQAELNDYAMTEEVVEANS
jgi:hypothetical protein